MMTSDIDQHRDAGRLATVGAAGALVLVVLVAVLHLVDPDRDPISITVSEYVLGPHGWLLSFAALAFGLGTLAIAVAVAAALPSPRPRIGLASLVIAGLGMVVVGAFPTDPIDPTDPRFVTTAGAIHQFGGLLGNSSATGLGERLMAVAFIAWLIAVAVTVRRAPLLGSR